MSRIEINGVTKKYGKTTALKNVNLVFEANKIHGLLGRNGAGKTTLLNLITNKIFPTEGEITVCGESAIENDKVLNTMFYMMEQNIFPKSTKVIEAFRWTSEIYKSFDMDYAKELSARFELNTSKKIKQLSTGYKSIFKAIATLASNAEIMLFDEPVLGLDAYHRDMFYAELIDNYSKNQKTIIVSTHLIEEVSNILEEVIIIKKGRIIKQESVENLLLSSYTIAGENSKVDEYLKDREYVGVNGIGEFKKAIVLEKNINKDINLANKLDLKFGKTELQKLFISLTES
ncbi:MAG: multidrug ABC transporter ATP-binding protein [Alkaliphilus sp.]|nr:ABC transporter ATP-binding protein [bacterium AH-315-G05]PHS35923.1 MAG: multidrug ABC transporter ATP-binding protein [Alkaliphilus sp.]